MHEDYFQLRELCSSCRFPYAYSGMEINFLGGNRRIKALGEPMLHRQNQFSWRNNFNFNVNTNYIKADDTQGNFLSNFAWALSH